MTTIVVAVLDIVVGVDSTATNVFLFFCGISQISANTN